MISAENFVFREQEIQIYLPNDKSYKPYQKMTVSTAQNMIPTAFWNALNNQNFEDLNTPQWSIVVNDAGIQCSIFFENQVQSGYILKNVLK